MHPRSGVARSAAEALVPSRRRFLAAAGGLVLSGAAGRAIGDDASRTGHVPWLEQVQQPIELKPEEHRQLRPLLRDASGQVIDSAAQWRVRREQLLEEWRRFLGAFPVPAAPPQIEVLEEEREAGVLRQLIRYQPEPGEEVQAYLLRPDRPPAQPRPAVAVFHSTVAHSIRQPAGVEGVPEKAFGMRLAERGYVAICPRNFLWPDNHHIAAQAEADRFHQRHPHRKGMARMLLDALVAVDILASQPDVDRQRMGAIGHSLGAKEVLYLAAFDPRIRAAVSSEGGIGTPFSNWDADWYLGPEINAPDFPLDHHELLAAVAPRAFLLVGGDSADGRHSWPYIDAALPVYRLFDSHPRLGLYNHGQGHAVPPQAVRRMDAWLDTYL